MLIHQFNEHAHNTDLYVLGVVCPYNILLFILLLIDLQKC